MMLYFLQISVVRKPQPHTIMTPLVVGIIAFPAGVIIACFFEWTLHRFIMHRPFRVPFIGTFQYAFKAHAQVHHNVFKSDHTYHLIKEEDKWTIPMAWWNGPVMVTGMVLILVILPMTLINMLYGSWFISLSNAVAISVSSLIAFAGYYATYEYTHWCMHLPRPEKLRLIERSWLFYRINGHHLLHHRYMHKNFNVVLPLADFCLGTLLLRSKIPFTQPRGPTVPNVQPTIVNKKLAVKG